MPTEAKVIITAINRVGAGVNQAVEDLNKLGQHAHHASRFFEKLFAIGAGFAFHQILSKVATETGKAGQAGEVFAGKIDNVKASFNNLLAVKGGLPEINEQLDQLSKVLQDPGTVAAADSLFSSMLASAVALTQGLAETVAGFRVLAVAAGLAEAKTQQDKIDVIGQKIATVEAQLYTLEHHQGIVGTARTDAVAKLKAQIDALKQLQAALYGPGKGDKETVLGETDSAKAKRLKEEAEMLSLQYVQMTQKHSKFFENMEIKTRTSVEKQVEELSQLRIAVELLYGAELAPPGTKVDRSEQFRRLNFKEFEEDSKAFFAANQALVQATIDEEQKAAKNAFDATQDLSKNIIDDISQFADEAARNIQSSFADFLFDPFKDGLGGMLKGFLDVVRRMIAEVAASSILEGIFGKKTAGGGLGGFLGGVFGNLFGKKFASGGSFMVAGSGGTDSTPVGFMATPGERVTVSRGGGGAGAPVINFMPTYNIGSGVNRNDVISAMAQTQQATIASITQLIRGGAFA